MKLKTGADSKSLGYENIIPKGGKTKTHESWDLGGSDYPHSPTVTRPTRESIIQTCYHVSFHYKNSLFVSPRTHDGQKNECETRTDKWWCPTFPRRLSLKAILQNDFTRVFRKEKFTWMSISCGEQNRFSVVCDPINCHLNYFSCVNSIRLLVNAAK